jgi:hypothetical protein
MKVSIVADAVNVSISRFIRGKRKGVAAIRGIVVIIISVDTVSNTVFIKIRQGGGLVTSPKAASTVKDRKKGLCALCLCVGYFS